MELMEHVRKLKIQSLLAFYLLYNPELRNMSTNMRMPFSINFTY